LLRICLALFVVLAGACAPRGELALAPGAVGGAPEPMLVASSRAPQGVGFGRAAGPGLSFARMTVSVPPDRVPGTVTFPRGPAPDPRRDFLITDGTPIADSAAFIRTVNTALATRPANQREVFVFVHGFNTNFAEGLYRQAQMRHDFGAPGVSVHYAWPSAASLTAYATDREAALAARDDLERLIDLLTRTKATRIVLAGHSMGAFLVMEALRQKAIRDQAAGFAKLGTVVLMAPDIDVSVFRRQARLLAEQDVSIYIFTSSRDRALRFSALLRGSGNRLGSLSDNGPIADLPVTVIDLTDVDDSPDALNHFKVATSPTMIALFNGMSSYGTLILPDETRQPGLIAAGAIAVLSPFADP
jgi:esterase/lipase superfamily enzyme